MNFYSSLQWQMMSTSMVRFQAVLKFNRVARSEWKIQEYYPKLKFDHKYGLVNPYSALRCYIYLCTCIWIFSWDGCVWHLFDAYVLIMIHKTASLPNCVQYYFKQHWLLCCIQHPPYTEPLGPGSYKTSAEFSPAATKDDIRPSACFQNRERRTACGPEISMTDSYNENCAPDYECWLQRGFYSGRSLRECKPSQWCQDPRIVRHPGEIPDR